MLIFNRKIITGPKKEQTFALLINLAFLVLLPLQATIIYLFGPFPLTIISKLFLLIDIVTICGVLTIWFALRTQFRDPGILDPHL